MDRLMYREGERITYQRRGGSWLAVSGYRNGDIFYRKSNLACRGTRWHIIELEYPREAKVPLDPIVTEIARRMGGHGTECGWLFLLREAELFKGAARNSLRLALAFSSDVDDTLCHEFTHEPMLARGGQRIHHGLEGTT
jgi:hypothetical protein